MRVDQDDLARLRMARALTPEVGALDCLLCMGAGVVQGLSGQYLPCPRCQIINNPTVPCKLCRAEGYIPVLAWTGILRWRKKKLVAAKCPDCRGMGSVDATRP